MEYILVPDILIFLPRQHIYIFQTPITYCVSEDFLCDTNIVLHIMYCLQNITSSKVYLAEKNKKLGKVDNEKTITTKLVHIIYSTLKYSTSSRCTAELGLVQLHTDLIQ